MENSSSAQIEQRLDEIEAQSRERQAELRALAAELPAAMSRRALLAQMARSVRDAPERSTVVKRTAAKVVRTPGDMVKRLRGSA